ncbi:hypothetical protein BB8028_0005g09610 [Beauveria bassiana]|uniref:Uncharacterized protein n=1 Tax=Beauveria bassiana TaxID=176275 RepID=A0A2S7YH00_BEABA|nr:hypothetical protein BB8028_0005g09610 [Beauveria bassiana]
MRSPLSFRPEEGVRFLRLPQRQDSQVQLERKGQAQKDCRHRPHALPQGCLAPLQEWLPNRPAQRRPRRLQGVNMSLWSSLSLLQTMDGRVEMLKPKNKTISRFRQTEEKKDNLRR